MIVLPPGVEHRGEGMTPFLGSCSFSRDFSLPSYRTGLMVYIELLLCARAGLGSRGDGCGGPCHQVLTAKWRVGCGDDSALCGVCCGVDL